MHEYQAVLTVIGSYTLQIFWKGDPGVENFKIQHPNEEGLTHWKKILQGQREQYTRADTPGRTKGGMLSTAATEFAWMAHTADSGDHGQDSQDVSDDDDDITVIQDNPHLSQLSGTTLSSSRNGSTTSLLRSRSATNENMPPPPPPSAAAFMPRSNGTQASPAWYPQQGNTPPLTLNTNPIIQALANSPERSNASYFSPVETPMPTGRSISSNSQGYFPRYTSSSTTYYEESIGSHYAPSMSRTSSREGSSQGAQYTAFQSPAFQNSQRLQRPSLPGMGAAATSAPNQQSRMRSASSPNIHHMPVPSGLSRSSPGGNIPPVPSLPIPSGLSRSSPSGIIPPVPSLPGGYIPYSGGPAVTNRNPEDPPASPDVAFLGAKEGPQTPGLDGGHNGLLTPNSGLASPPSNTKTQIKVKIHYNNDTLAIIVPYNIAYSQLIDRIERKVKFCGIETPIRIRYQDEDGDKISMNSDDDVQMAFDVAGCEGNGKDIGGQVTLYVQVG